jgi:hypothetical protein
LLIREVARVASCFHPTDLVQPRTEKGLKIMPPALAGPANRQA